MGLCIHRRLQLFNSHARCALRHRSHAKIRYSPSHAYRISIPMRRLYRSIIRNSSLASAHLTGHSRRLWRRLSLHPKPSNPVAMVRQEA